MLKANRRVGQLIDPISMSGKWLVTCAVVIAGIGGPNLWAQKLPDGAGKAALMKVCGACHEAEVVAGQARTRDAWTQVINDMLALGADGTDEELNAIVNYLSTNFPRKVNVNSAPATEIQHALEVSVANSEEIVKYREKNGSFKSLDDLKKVPGLDAQKLDAEKSRILF
jgi:competence protein ComEA